MLRSMRPTLLLGSPRVQVVADTGHPLQVTTPSASGQSESTWCSTYAVCLPTLGQIKLTNSGAFKHLRPKALYGLGAGYAIGCGSAA